LSRDYGALKGGLKDPTKTLSPSVTPLRRSIAET
jgi:hypothetical protein